MTRNWRAILIDAQQRGLSPAELAREQKCRRGDVSNANRTHKIPLVKKPCRSISATRKAGDPAFQRRAELAEAKWRARFAAAPELGLNAFCLRFHCSAGWAQRWAARLGHQFPKTKGRSR